MDFISQVLGKDAESIGQKDILDYIKTNGIRILNLCYIGSDSKLKCVSFPISDFSYIEAVLSRGERIANVFLKESIKTEGCFIVPRYGNAFLNPFAKEPTLNILCSCFDKDGAPFFSAPSTVLERAATRFTEKTGLTLNGAGEIEYFVLYPESYDLFETTHKHYDATSPFTVWENMRNEAVHTMTSLGIPVKYAHSECGKIFSVLSLQGERVSSLRLNAEQHEIEFLPVPICDSADNIVISKWVICNVAKKYGVRVTFSPVIEYRKPGNGMHFHLELLRGGKNIVLDKEGKISVEAKKMIGGILKFAGSLCAFGNPVPTSYLRLMGKKDSPYGICWAERSRKALIRIPMKWHGMGSKIGVEPSLHPGQTIEYRCADGSAVTHLLLAGLTVAAEHGLGNKSSLDIAEKLQVVEEEISRRKLGILPQNCLETAEELEKDRRYYAKDGIFAPELIDSIILELKSYKDEDILSNLFEKEVKKLIEKYIHYFPFSFD